MLNPICGLCKSILLFYPKHPDFITILQIGAGSTEFINAAAVPGKINHALHGLLSDCTYPRLSGTSVKKIAFFSLLVLYFQKKTNLSFFGNKNDLGRCEGKSERRRSTFKLRCGRGTATHSAGSAVFLAGKSNNLFSGRYKSASLVWGGIDIRNIWTLQERKLMPHPQKSLWISPNLILKKILSNTWEEAVSNGNIPMIGTLKKFLSTGCIFSLRGCGGCSE